MKKINDIKKSIQTVRYTHKQIKRNKKRKICMQTIRKKQKHLQNKKKKILTTETKRKQCKQQDIYINK
jgi:hypothetical protein